jgi:hypothetical protein
LSNPHTWVESSKYKPPGHSKYWTVCWGELAKMQT